VVYEIATRSMLFGRFEVVIEGSYLAATAYGEPLDPTHHHPAVAVKGASYTALRGWLGNCGLRPGCLRRFAMDLGALERQGDFTWHLPWRDAMRVPGVRIKGMPDLLGGMEWTAKSPSRRAT
jgi:hypothetical protein